MNKQQIIFFSMLFTVSFALNEYSREFQFFLDMEYFNDGREAGFARYLDSFAVNGFSIENMTRGISYRTQLSIPLDSCGSDGKLRLRQYIQGDRTGFTLDLKSGQSLSEAEALAEPFTISPEYVADSKFEIEYDIHPCRADFAATARIYFDSAIEEFTSCEAVRKYYPEFSNEEGTLEQAESSAVVYVEAFNGFAWGGEIKLEFTLYYETLEEAVNDLYRKRGEFSYTIYAPGTDQFTDEQTEKGIEVYKYMLNDVGESTYPCDPAVDVADFFADDYLDNINSEALGLTVNIILVAFIVLVASL